MKIQCKSEREGGTVIELDDKTYHFKPSKGSTAHICEVKDKAHIERFLDTEGAYFDPNNVYEVEEDNAALTPSESEEAPKPKSTPRKNRQ